MPLGRHRQLDDAPQGILVENLSFGLGLVQLHRGVVAIRTADDLERREPNLGVEDLQSLPVTDIGVRLDLAPLHDLALAKGRFDDHVIRGPSAWVGSEGDARLLGATMC